MGYLPTDKNLVQKGLSFASRCSLCASHSKDGSHLFTSCSFSAAMWNAILMLFGRRIVISGSLYDLIYDAMQHGFSSQLAALWCSVIVHDVVVIWRSQNAVIFYEESPNIHAALRFIWTSLKETDFYHFGKMYNSMDEFHILKLLNISCIPRRAPRMVFVLWQPPPFSWIKVNIDGSSFGTTGAVGVGGIFRTPTRFPHGAFSFDMGTTPSYFAELSAAIHAIESASEKGWTNLWLECDSLWIVSLFRRFSKDVP